MMLPLSQIWEWLDRWLPYPSNNLSVSNEFVQTLSKARCVQPYRFANTVARESAEASPLKHTAASEGGAQMTVRSDARGGCHSLGAH